MTDPAKGQLSKARINWWVMIGVFAVVFALIQIAARLPLFGHSRYAAYAHGEMAKLSFKSAGQPAPAVAFAGPDGKTLSLAAFRGKTILVNLWATWCAPCISELPSLDKLQAALGGKDFEVVPINMDAAPASVAEEFLTEHALGHLPRYTDRNLLMDPALAGPGIPTSVLYDAKGREIARLYGAADWSSPEARALIAAALKPQS